MMKRNFKSMIAGVIAVCMCITMEGCGDSKPKNEKELESMLENMPEEDWEKRIEDAAESIDSGSFSYEVQDSAEEINPFEDFAVTFSGTYPESKVECKGGSPYVNYTPDIEKGMKSGDTIVITAELKSSYENRYKLTETQMKYAVVDLCSYAMSIDEIPDDMKNKMAQQAHDAILANSAKWKDSVSLDKSDMIGYYFLTLKEGYSQNPHNELYLVYSMSTNVTGLKRGGDGETEEKGTESYYTYYRFSDIILMPDGTCSVNLSDGKLADNVIESDYGYWDLIATFYKYNGYKDLDSMFNDCVVANTEKYSYESTVQ